MCFGHSRPDESVLNQVGLTCEGSLQTANCDAEDLSAKQQAHCDDFLLLQGMESLAIFSTFVATFINSLARTCARNPLLRSALRLSSIVSLVIALSSASAVIRLLKMSDMVDERSFSCSKVLGAELCHGFGASYGLQYAAIAELALALMVNIVLLCVAPTESATYQYVRVPLLHQQQGGVILHPPPSSTFQGGQVISTQQQRSTQLASEMI